MKHLTIENTIHGVMIAFALASVANVASYFIITKHHATVALIMAIALGTAVASSAIMLTKIDMMKQTRRYIAVALMVLALVSVSGFVQMQNYLAHDLSTPVSAAMGFGIVFSGECLTAIALSLYQAAERRRMLDEADAGLEMKMVEVFAETLDAVNVGNSAKYVQQHIDAIVQHKADQLLAKYVPIVEELPRITVNSTPNPLVDPRIAAQKSADSRQSKRDKRRAEIAQFLTAEYYGISAEQVTPKIIVDKFGVSRDTARTDIQAVWKMQNWNGSVGA